MNKMRTLLAAFVMFCLCVSIAGCSPGSVEQFASDAAGTWLRNGNSRDELLEVGKDGTWTQQRLEEDQWTTIAKGIIGYNKEEKKYEFDDEMNNRVYMVAPVKDGILSFSGDDYYRVEVSVDAIEGNWYLNNDKDDNYFQFEGKRWSFHEAQGIGHSPVNSGYLMCDSSKKELTAYEDTGSDPFTVFTILSTEDIKAGSEWYARIEDLTLDDKTIEFDGDSVLLTPENAYVYDNPIIMEGDDVAYFGGWLCKSSPAAYWSVIIPEAGNYNVSVHYSREESNPVRGEIRFEIWAASRGEWINYSGISTHFTFESTGGWSDYETTGGVFSDLPEGELKFLIAPGYYAHEDSTYFINLRSVHIEKVAD